MIIIRNILVIILIIIGVWYFIGKNLIKRFQGENNNNYPICRIFENQVDTSSLPCILKK